MQNKFLDFRGSGVGYFWLLLWTTIITMITLGLYFPWAYAAQQRWINDNTYLNGQQLQFTGTGLGFFWQWLLIVLFTFITLGLYAPWGYCRIKRWETENVILR